MEKRRLRKISEKIIAPFVKERTRAVVKPFASPKEKLTDSETVNISIYNYNEKNLTFFSGNTAEDCFAYTDSSPVTWINVDGINKEIIEKVSSKFGIHYLIQEDILSYGQRPKVDEVENIIYVLLNMLYYNETSYGIEQEQISIVLSKKMVISFQEDETRDVFNPIREKLKIGTNKIRQREADYLFYSLIDMIVDSYFVVIEKLGERIELIEEKLLLKADKHTFQTINQLRKEMILLKRNVAPVRDILAAILRTDNKLLDETTEKFFKDVYDHTIQVNELAENYRDMIMSLQDLYINTVNLRMNDVMKTLAIVTTVMAPATVIGGIFGMNFQVIPYQDQSWGFYATVGLMLIIPILMIFWFKKRGWFLKDLPDEVFKP